MSNKLHIVSLGCTKNLVDTEVMLGRLANFELTDDESEADVIIVNTCGFIEAAKKESLQTVLNLHEARKDDSLLVMAGCLSERYKEELSSELSEVDIFTGVGDYERIDELLALKKSRFSEGVYLIDGAKRIITGSNYHAYIKISEGCNQSCSFCAIPSFKGKLKSRSLDSIATEVERLVAEGFWDFTFISQDSSSFMRDEGVRDGLSLLVERIELIEGVRSARILYLYPSTISLKTLEKIAKSKIFHNYFDMPIQHIDNDMLRTMKRGFGTKETMSLLEYMKSLDDVFIRTSFIVGHPDESEEQFDSMCEFAKSFGFDRINVFAYSDEEGTFSHQMQGKIAQKVINQRAKKLGKIADEVMHASLEKMVGKSVVVVIDGESSESELILGSRVLAWCPDIDGEILVTDKEIDAELVAGRAYEAKIKAKLGDKLDATITKEL